MSEYQRYEFMTVDRPLTKKEQEVVDALAGAKFHNTGDLRNRINQVFETTTLSSFTELFLPVMLSAAKNDRLETQRKLIEYYCWNACCPDVACSASANVPSMPA